MYYELYCDIIFNNCFFLAFVAFVHKYINNFLKTHLPIAVSRSIKSNTTKPLTATGVR